MPTVEWTTSLFCKPQANSISATSGGRRDSSSVRRAPRWSCVAVAFLGVGASVCGSSAFATGDAGLWDPAVLHAGDFRRFIRTEPAVGENRVFTPLAAGTNTLAVATGVASDSSHEVARGLDTPVEDRTVAAAEPVQHLPAEPVLAEASARPLAGADSGSVELLEPALTVLAAAGPGSGATPPSATSQQSGKRVDSPEPVRAGDGSAQRKDATGDSSVPLRSSPLRRLHNAIANAVPQHKAGPRPKLSTEEFVSQTLGDAQDSFIRPEDRHDGSSVTLLESGLSLRDFVNLVALRNDRVAYQKMEWAIAKSQTDSARAMYEPVLTATYRHTDSNTPNTTEEEFRRSFASEFVEENDDYGIGIEGLTPTGGRLKLAYSLRSLDNNIQPTPIRGEEEKSYVGLSVTQPLFRGAGGRKVVSAPILVAEKDQGIARETFRQALFETISNAVAVYWDVYLAEQKVALRARSVEIAEKVVADERARGRFGQSAATDVMDVESGLAQRRVQYLSARQDLVGAHNDFRRYIARKADSDVIRLALDSALATTAPSVNREASLSQAYKNRPEYLASLIRAEKEEVRIKFARNNRLPQLDLVASYGLNGLEDSAGKAWDEAWEEDHKTYYIGFEYRMELLGNRRAKGELNAAKLRKHQALLEIKAAEIAIHNSVDTALQNLESAGLQVAELATVKGTNNRLMEIGLARFEAGQSNSRDLLELEERMNRALEMELESQINLQKALVGVGLAQGTLLREFDLER